MIEMYIVEDETALRSFCASSAVAYDEDVMAYAASFCGGVIGYCLFVMSEKVLTILAEGVSDEYGAELCDGLTRAALSYAATRGVLRAEFAAGVSTEVWQKLQSFGYTQKIMPDIDKFLTGCKNCSKKQ
ncbi:MAG: hypothetical protein RR115_00175 [Hydrogenoanaerobacterium sp.]